MSDTANLSLLQYCYIRYITYMYYPTFPELLSSVTGVALCINRFIYVHERKEKTLKFKVVYFIVQ